MPVPSSAGEPALSPDEGAGVPGDGTPVGRCVGCGRPGTECPGCATAYDPPRFCEDCGRRLTVQVTPTGWRAHCRRCSATTRS